MINNSEKPSSDKKIDCLRGVSIITMALLLSMFVSDKALAQQNVCDAFLRAEQEMNRGLPQRTDAVTEMVQVRVNCELRIVSYIMRLTIDESGLAQGWQERKIRQHHQLHCNSNGLARTTRWTARTVLHSASVPPRLLQELITTPRDCD